MKAIVELANALSEKGYAVAEEVIDAKTCNLFLHYLKEKHAEDELKKAGIGAGGDFQKNKTIRGDFIHWLTADEENLQFKAWFSWIDSFSAYLNQQLFVGVRDREFHLAFYPPKTFYKKHLDQFKGRSNRLLSCILYLNDGWQEGDGGELKIYFENNEHLLIAPRLGTFVCFRSELFEHEVLPTNSARYSLTGWLLNYPKGIGFLGY